MNQQNKNRIDYKVWAIILIVIGLSFINALNSVRCWEMDEQISLLSASINEITRHQEGKTDQEPEQKPEDNQEPEEIIVPTTLKINSAAYYYSPQGDQLGVGPLPPMVDIQTNYWVFWELENFNRNLQNLTITAQLPDNVVWTDNKTVLAGNLKFGEITRKIVWQTGQLERNQGPYKVGFEIGLIPVQADVGNILDLVTNIQYSAVDSLGNKLEGVLDKIDTDLVLDELSTGKGEVIPFE
jgi:hypothetical protein